VSHPVDASRRRTHFSGHFRGDAESDAPGDGIDIDTGAPGSLRPN